MNTTGLNNGKPREPGRVDGSDWDDPPAVPSAAKKMPGKDELFNSFAEDFAPIEGKLNFWKVIDDLLRSPARIAHSLVEGRSIAVLVWLCITILGGYLAYGLVMASFSGGAQYWIVPLKMVWGIFLTVCICFPSLYIFSSLAGAEQDVFQVMGLVLMSVAMSAVLLLGFAPITWVFSQSTGTLYFMGLLHLTVWSASAWFGYKLLSRAMGHINSKNMVILRAWACIFLVVAIQMTVNLRPLIGSASTDVEKGKKFFLTYWSELLEGM